MAYQEVALLIQFVAGAAAAWLCKQFAVWLCTFYSTQRWLKTTSIPGPPASNKLIGHVSTLLSDRCPLQLADWANSYGPVYKLQLLNRACVILTDPAAAHELIRWGNSENYLGKTRELYRALELGTEPKMPNILTSPDDVYWKAVRQATAPCFSISNLKLVFPWVLQLCDKAVHHVTSSSSSSSTADGKPGPAAAAAAAAASIDVEDLAKRFTADVIGHMLFAEDLKSMDMGKSQYLEIFAALLEEVHNHFSNPLRSLMLKAMGWRPEVARGRDALAIHDQLMGAKLKAQLASPPPEYTITGHLLKVRDPATGQPLSFAQAKAEMAIMMGAGFETTSHALSWTLAALAAHPDVQDTLAAELAAAGLTPNKQQQQQQQRPLEWGDLALPYLNAVIKESLRLFSPAALGTSRACHKDVSVCGHTLPKGMHVIIPPYPIGVSIANYGPTAPRFIPERWLDTQQLEHLDALRESAGLLPRAAAAAAAVGFGHSSNSSSSRKLAELAFSTGPRDCVGQSLAKLELQAMIATLAGHFALAPGKALQERLAGIATAAAADEAAGSAAVDEDADVDGEGESAGFVSQPNPADALKACIMYHVTLQPRGGNMVLRFTPRC
uniref:Cytochrome P450 n=1 Tax=Tetradesmus obliquus TaxID=3088 RepID=A0A383V6F6_TETOB|eukprot:jgi/Sobl393_1/10654/SZX74690.1